VVRDVISPSLEALPVALQNLSKDSP